MRSRALCLSVLLLLSTAALAGQHSPWEARVEHPLPAGQTVRMHLEGGGYVIEGTDSNSIVVTYDAGSDSATAAVKVNIQAGDSGADLSVRNTPHSGFTATIEVPRRSGLRIRLTAGDLKIEDVEGNKDVDALAGEVQVQIARPEDYGIRDISVTTGSIEAPAFNVDKGGLFRSYHQVGPGKYSLRIHVTAGEVYLNRGL